MPWKHRGLLTEVLHKCLTPPNQEHGCATGVVRNGEHLRTRSSGWAGIISHGRWFAPTAQGRRNAISVLGSILAAIREATRCGDRVRRQCPDARRHAETSGVACRSLLPTPVRRYPAACQQRPERCRLRPGRSSNAADGRTPPTRGNSRADPVPAAPPR